LLVEEQKYLPIASTPAAPSVAVFIYPPHLLVIVLECPWGDTVSSLKVMIHARRTDVTHLLHRLFIYLFTNRHCEERWPEVYLSFYYFSLVFWCNIITTVNVKVTFILILYAMKKCVKGNCNIGWVLVTVYILFATVLKGLNPGKYLR
jgi:hypothetical protein